MFRKQVGSVCKVKKYQYMNLKKCPYCKYKYVNLNNYHWGFLPNNKDEYKTGECPKCGGNVVWECNYDSSKIVRLYKNNMVVLGCYMKSYNKPSHAVSGLVSDEMFDKILSNTVILEVDCPDNWIGKRKLQTHIDEQIPDSIYDRLRYRRWNF